MRIGNSALTILPATTSICTRRTGRSFSWACCRRPNVALPTGTLIQAQDGFRSDFGFFAENYGSMKTRVLRLKLIRLGPSNLGHALVITCPTC